MKKINAIVIGTGNVGLKTIDILQHTKDFNLLGIVRREAKPLTNYPNLKVVSSIDDFDEKIDVALLSVPTREVEKYATLCLSKGISTVDSFDIHGEILGLRTRLNEVAKKHDAVAVISSGWDPGSDSIIRALYMAMAPKGMTYTNFGPGMSMGHTVAVKSKEGVKNALSMTIPTGTGIHRRMVYVELLPGADKTKVEQAIKADPYFAYDETHIQFVEDVQTLIDVGHGVELTRKGGAGTTDNQNFCFTMSINNPALTAQVMISSARAALRQQSGAYTLIELPLVDFLEGDKEQWIKALV